MGFYLSTPFSMVDFLLPSLPEGTARNSKQKIAMPATQPTLLAKARGQSTSLHFDVGNPGHLASYCHLGVSPLQSSIYFKDIPV